MPEPTAFDAYRATRRFDALDGLRAAAAGAVVWHHCGHVGDPYFDRGVGSTTFFVISGFLITWLLLRERRERGAISIRAFWWRRALRIFPLYYAVLAVYVVLVAAFERRTAAGARFWETLPFYATFTANWFVVHPPDDRAIFSFSWSLALQEQFYLAWPVILQFLRRRYAVLVPLAFLGVEDVASWAVRAGHLQSGIALRMIASIDSPIFLGVLLALLLETPVTFDALHAISGKAWSVPLALACVIAPRWIPSVPQLVFFGAVAYLVVSCALAAGAWARVIGNRLVRHVAKVSFGIYLLQGLALNFTRRVVPGASHAVQFVLGFSLSVLMATASFRWFEQYFLRMRPVPIAPALLPATAPVRADAGLPPA